MKLILADDHTLFRDGLALLLKAHCADCEVWEGDGLDAALAEAQAHPDADVALLDLHMPGMDGVQGIRRFVELHPTLPLIILTGAEDPQQIQDVLAAGASGFIPKSSTPAVMLSAIQLVRSGGTYIPPQFLFSASVSAHTPPSSSIRERAQTQLTDRQMQVLRLLAAGKPNKAICRELNIEEGTVKAHIATVFRVLDVANRTEAASVARTIGLLD
ncbi:MAG: response regulator transcription factor [Thiobacillus sp.]|jgi:DNA-binding NarL/FixJ family response regulator|nr:response regulator transcription factor [Thiobacillus sp.]